jgi:hypothetical protein
VRSWGHSTRLFSDFLSATDGTCIDQKSWAEVKDKTPSCDLGNWHDKCLTSTVLNELNSLVLLKCLKICSVVDPDTVDP